MRARLLTGDRGRRTTAAVAAVLLGGGAVTLGVAACQQQSPAEPPVAASTPAAGGPPSASVPPAATASASPSATASATTPRTAPDGLSRSPAVSISIPAIRVQSGVQQVGLDARGAIDVPQPGPHYDEAAWFTGSPAPGQVGPSTIVGHIDSAKNGPSVFFELGALGKGDHVTVKRQDGKAVTFTVYRAERYHKDAFPTQAVYGNTSGPELRLITCGGSFDSGTGHYVDNIVVYARQSG